MWRMSHSLARLVLAKVGSKATRESNFAGVLRVLTFANEPAQNDTNVRKRDIRNDTRFNARSRSTLFNFQAGEFHDFPPLVGLGLDRVAKCVRRLDQRLAAEFDQALSHVRLRQDCIDL